MTENPIDSLELDLIRGATGMSLLLEHWCEPLVTLILRLMEECADDIVTLASDRLPRYNAYTVDMADGGIRTVASRRRRRSDRFIHVRSSTDSSINGHGYGYALAAPRGGAHRPAW